MTELWSRIFLGTREIAVSILAEKLIFARIGSMDGSEDARHFRIKGMSCPCFDFVGGRLARFAEARRCITSDAWVIQTVCDGLRLDFLENPIQTAIFQKVSMGSDLIQACSKELKDLLSKRGIRKIIDDSKGFLS